MLDSIFTFNGCWTVAMCGMQCNTDAPLKHIAPQQGCAGRSIFHMGRDKGENPRGGPKNMQIDCFSDKGFSHVSVASGGGQQIEAQKMIKKHPLPMIFE